MELFYNHKNRTITDGDDKELSVNDAKLLVDGEEVTDWNIAFQTLVNHNFDMNAVDSYYKSFNSP